MTTPPARARNLANDVPSQLFAGSCLFSLYFVNRLTWLLFAAETDYLVRREVLFPPDETVSPLLHPDLMTPAERLDEIAEILAAGILRLRARQRALGGRTAEQVRVDFSPRRSGHGQPSGGRRRRA